MINKLHLFFKMYTFSYIRSLILTKILLQLLQISKLHILYKTSFIRLNYSLICIKMLFKLCSNKEKQINNMKDYKNNYKDNKQILEIILEYIYGIIKL